MTDLKPEAPPESATSRCSWQAVFGADDRIDCVLPAGHESAHDYAAPVVPEHDCSYPPNGLLDPAGNCVTCGEPSPSARSVPVDEAFLRTALRDALAFAQYHATAGDPDSPAYIREYETALLQLADAPELTTRADWGVAYEGNPAEPLFGIREYDCREDAEAVIAQGFADVLVSRTLTATPWQRAEAAI